MSAIVLAVGNVKTLFAPEGTPIHDNDDDIVRFIDPHSACVSAFDLSVLRGDGIFEATTVWQGFPVSWEIHIRRLANSAGLMDMPTPNQAAFIAAARQVIAKYDASEPGPMLRVLVSRGLDPATGIGAEQTDSQQLPNVWMFLDGRGKLHDTNPITLTTLSRGYASDVTAKAPWLLNGAKTLSYAVNQSIHRECARRGVDDAVTFSTDGFTLECPNSSIVAQFGDRFITPDPRIGILHGTSQRELFAWALEEGFAAEYRKVPLAQLREADRLYMTHGGWVIPVASLDSQSYEVDATQIEQINDAIHTGRTHDDALTVGPTGDYN